MTTSDRALPTGQLYGQQTSLGVENFPLRGQTLGETPAFVRNFARVKLAAATVNHSLGVVDAARRDAIVLACQEVIDGKHADQFPSPLVQGGGGTTTNMNVNEVVANRASALAGKPVHPNDHVNASQSTNDTFPTAMALTILELAVVPVATLRELAEAFEEKAQEFSDVLHLGRTCLQDAVALTAGNSHLAHAQAMRRVADDLERSVSALHELPLGGTAIGNGLGAPSRFGELAVRELASLSALPLSAASNPFDVLAHMDPYSAIAAAGSRAAITMGKIAADVRLLSSGPRGGFADLTIPATQAGSSIMPGKVNPVIPEYVLQLSYRVRGRALTIDCAVADGELELNVMEPVVLDSLISIFGDLTAAAGTFAKRCIAGLRWDGLRRESNLSAALDGLVQSATREGYESVSERVRARSV